jgi:hypothetical protein
LKKLEPAPKVEGKTPWKKLDNAVRHIFTVSKEDILKAEAKEKQTRQKKRSKQKALHSLGLSPTEGYVSTR